MLEKIPAAVGRALSGLKAGLEKTTYHAAFAEAPETIALTSSAFADGGALPARFTADGDGTSPPLAWSRPARGHGRRRDPSPRTPTAQRRFRWST